MRALLGALIIMGSLTAVPVWAQKKQLNITGDHPWMDTGIDLQGGDTLRIEAEGTLKYSGSRENGPEGQAREWLDLIRILPMNGAGRGALIGRIGDRASARPFLIGPRRESKVPLAGRLYLGINQLSDDKPEGKFRVTVERIPAVAGTKLSAAAVPKLPQERLNALPRRVTDKDGAKGDSINFLIVGSQDKLQAALKSAGWVLVDQSVRDTVLRGVLASLSKEAYTTLPMSELFFFGRSQDFGYAQADPIRVVAARHHFRIWKAPFTLQGETVWVGAGTHDIGFDRDARTGRITHKIDPEVDKERDYIGQSLSESGAVVKLDYMTPSNSVREARTAHGESYHSDGRTLLIYLESDHSNTGRSFADFFCSVLKQKNPDTGQWGPCQDYMEGGGREDLPLPALSTKYRVLIVPGFFSSCVTDYPAFQEGQKSLREQYGLKVELLPIPNDASEDNARRIAAYLKEKMRDESRKYIVVGYSKGTPDMQVALAKETGVKEAVAAFISVAGASGGSPIADTLPAQLDRWLQQYHFGKCEGNAAQGFKSLQRAVRQAFLASYPSPVVPTYSLAAVSDRARTSKALQQTWQLLTAFGSMEDGQLVKEDAIVPGSKYLGVARADHFAVALPFDKATDETLRVGMDKTRYPRAALLEALIRLVAQDLGGAE